jgi:hypothetical protein
VASVRRTAERRSHSNGTLRQLSAARWGALSPRIREPETLPDQESPLHWAGQGQVPLSAHPGRAVLLLDLHVHLRDLSRLLRVQARPQRRQPAGCYADAGKTVHTIARLDREAAPFSGDDVVVSEADLIDRAFPAGMPQDGARGGRDLRLHVGGDTTSRDATVFLGQAATRWRKRGGGKVWTYTHRWHEVLRSNWGPDISVLASVENPREADTALDHGYAPAIVVPRHASAKTWVGEYGIKFIPCPAETGDRVCVECRLCFDDTALKKRETGIAFAIHGSHKPRALTRLGYGQRKLL